MFKLCSRRISRATCVVFAFSLAGPQAQGSIVVDPFFVGADDVSPVYPGADPWNIAGELLLGSGTSGPDGIPGDIGVLRINGGSDVTNTTGRIAVAGGSAGTVDLSGAGSTWTSTHSLFVGVGLGSSATFTSSAGASVFVGDVAQAGSQTGSLTVSDSSSITNNGGLLMVQNGGSLNHSGIAYLGDDPNEYGTATVTGAGSTWTNSSTTMVGRLGTGTLNILAGGRLSGLANYLGFGGGATGTATVNGTGSALNYSSFMSIGNNGAGTLHVEAGGAVTNTDGTIGTFAGSAGTATVTGPDSTWTNTRLFVGGLSSAIGGTGSLNVLDSGLVDVTGGLMLIWNTGTVTLNGGAIHVNGDFDNSLGGTLNFNDGTLKVAGGAFKSGMTAYTINGPSAVELPTLVLADGATAPGVTGDFVVGNGNRGRLELLNGSTLSSKEVDLGQSAGGFGQALVDGAGSLWSSSSANAFAVGEDGTGELTVTNGGAVSTSNFFVIGRGVTSNGTVDVGSGGSINANNTNIGVVIGERSYGAMYVNAGGSVTSAGHVRMGSIASSDGFLTVAGPGATFIANKTLNVGGWEGGNGGSGTLSVFEGGRVEVVGQLNIYNSGEIDLDGGTLVANSIDHTFGGFRFHGGTLSVGTFTGTLDQDGGTLAPGSSPGTTTVSADYNLNAGSIAIELDGLTAGTEHDQVSVTGALNLGATSVLDVTLINAFTPNVGDSFDILDWGSITGTFSTISLPTLGGGLGWNASNLLLDGTLSVFSTFLSGDLNGDGFVGIADLNIVLGAWNQSVPPGNPLADPSGDGFVGIADLNVVLGNWNARTPPGLPATQANIPEPGALILLGLGITSFIHTRPRPKS